MRGELRVRLDLRPLESLQRRSPAAFRVALERGAVQFLTWCNTGSAGSPKKPPIRFGVLRGSSSAFVGGRLVQMYPQAIRPGGEESPSPATSHSAPETTATFVWNTEYAARMHEWRGGWGPFTTQDGDAGAKWLESHLRTDRDAFVRMIAAEYRRETGT